MTNNLFKKVAVFTDLHIGAKSNSTIHNEDCEQFIDWFIETAKANGCEVGMFLGDYHHNRSSLNILSMDYSVRCLEKLGAAFEKFYFLPGNHDLYLKDRRDVFSVIYGKFIPGITIIEKPMTIGNVTLCPWLIGEEWKTVGKTGGRYIFGHFELPGFFLNSMVRMPDTGEIRNEQFKPYELGFSGHFHQRQTDGNINYIGNAFPHNYADAGDDARGMMILEWGGVPEYQSWPKQPTYRTYKLSEVISEPDRLLKEGMHCRVTIDIPITFEEANFIKETFIPQYNLREMHLVPTKADVNADLTAVDISFETVDTIVMSQIESIDTESFDKNLLMAIYQEL